MQLKPKTKTQRKKRQVEWEETWFIMSDIPTCPKTCAATCPHACPATCPRTLTRWDWACWPTGCCTAATGSSSWTSSSLPGGAGQTCMRCLAIAQYTLSFPHHSTQKILDPNPSIQWGVLVTFIKSHFLRRSKIHPRRCIETFTSEDKHRHLFCCVLLVPEYLVWFISSCTAQADTAAPQHHSCFTIHSTELDWRTVRPIQYLDLSSQNMVCKVSSRVIHTHYIKTFLGNDGENCFCYRVHGVQRRYCAMTLFQ